MKSKLHYASITILFVMLCMLVPNWASAQTCTVRASGEEARLAGGSNRIDGIFVKWSGDFNPYTWFEMNNYVQRHLQSVRLKDVATGSEGEIFNSTGAKNNGAWFPASGTGWFFTEILGDDLARIRPGFGGGLSYTPNKEYEFIFVLDNSNEIGAAEVWVTGYSKSDAIYANGEHYDVIGRDQHRKVTYNNPSCTVVSTTQKDEYLAAGSYSTGDIKVKWNGNSSPDIWVSMNKFAADNLEKIKISDGTQSGYVISNYTYNDAFSKGWWCGRSTGEGDNWVGTIRPLFKTASSVPYAADKEYTITFEFGNVAAEGVAELWVSGYSAGEANDPNASYSVTGETAHSKITFKEVPCVAKQIENYVGRGNKNEPLLTMLATFDGTQCTTFSFKPFGSGTGSVDSYKVYAREYPKSGSLFYGENGIDLGYFHQADPTKWGDVTYLGEAAAETDGSYSFTLQNPLSGKYYLVVTADVKDSAKEGDKLGATLVQFDGVESPLNTVESKYREVVISRHNIFTPFDGYSKFYRIPAIITGDDGRMLVTSDARKFHNHDVRNDIDVLARYSMDNGATWSNPLVVAQGSGMDADHQDCTQSNVVAFGDAALSNLPTPGHMVAAVISGEPLWTTTSGSRPTVYYMTSTNNGVTWSTPKMISDNLFTATSGAAQGCPSPGRMCLVKEGKWKGKVLGSFYIWENQKPKTLNFFTYDESTDTWERVGEMDDLSSAGIEDANWRGGESQFVEVGEDQFILSSRVDARSISGSEDVYRSWFYCTITEDGKIKMEHIRSKFIETLPVTSCSNMVTYKQPETGKTYFLQCMATETSNYENNGWSCRNNVRLKYAEFKGAEDLLNNGLTWQTGRSITKGMATAGYSCLTVQQNGTIGFVSEDYPVAYYYKSCDNPRANGDVLLAINYINFSVEWLSADSEVKLTNMPLADVTLAAPVIDPLTGTFAVDANGKMLKEKDKEIYRNGSIKVVTEPSLEDGEHYAIEYVISLTKAGAGDTAGKTVTITLKEATTGDNVGEEALDITQILEKLADEGNKVEDLDQITVSARTVVCDADGKLLRNSVYTTETYRAVNPGRVVKVIVKAVNTTDERLLRAANVKPSMIVNGKEYVAEFEKPIDQVVGLNQKVALFANNTKIGHLKGFSLHANTYVVDSLSQKDVFSAYVVSDGTQHQFVMPTVENYAGNECDLNRDDHDDTPVVVYAWYEVPGGGLYQHADAGNKDESSDKTGIWSSDNDNVNEDMTEDEMGNLEFNKPTDKNNTGRGLDLIDSDSEDATLSLTLIPDVVSVYNSAYVVVRLKDGTLLKNADGKVVYARFTGIFGAESAGAKRRAAEVIGEDAVEISSEDWYDTNTNNPKKVTATFTIGKLLNSGKTTATDMATIETYVVADQSVSAQDAAEQAVYNVKQTVTSRITVPLDVETVEEELVAEAPALTVTVLGGGEVMFESAEPTVVSVYNVAGSLVARFPLEGKQVKRLAQGFYIASDVKFVVK